MPRRPHRPNRGFTLVELLIVIAVTGVTVTALSSSIVFIIRNMETTNERVAATTDEQNLVTWLPADVSSAANLLTTESFAAATDPNATSGCASPSLGINVLLL